MRIAILGTRGIPNNYGGFEQCAENISAGLARLGHDVTVYSSHKHYYLQPEWNNVNIIHCYDPEYKYGTIGQFIYDLNCILDARKRNYDIILQLGYTSSSLWGWLLPARSIVTTNMDGLEWKRTKYSKPVRLFLKFAEQLGVKYSDYLISDSNGIQQYLLNKYKRESIYIPYGANAVKKVKLNTLKEYKLNPYRYFLLIARMEPENSIEIILDGVVDSESKTIFLVIGNNSNKYGKYLLKKYKGHSHIKFIGGVYDINTLNDLRSYSALYFHGHTVGGTNPSLLEAMACNCLICAHDNDFNKEVLENNSYYFRNSSDISKLLKEINYDVPEHKTMINDNRNKINEKFRWESIVESYEGHFINILKLGKYFS